MVTYLDYLIDIDIYASAHVLLYEINRNIC